MKYKKGYTTTAMAILLLCIAAIAACDNGYDCELNNTSYNNIGFYTI